MGLLGWLQSFARRRNATMPNPAVDVLGAATLPPDPLPAVVIPARPSDAVVEPTVALLRALDWASPDIWSAALTKACATHGIHTRDRLAAFLANVGHETNGGRRLVESLDYTPDRLRAVFGSRATPDAIAACRGVGKAADQRAIANIVYGGEWGMKNLGNMLPDDGWTYRGRGLMQLTGRANYTRFATVHGAGLDAAFLRSLETPMGAAVSAAQFWASTGCNDHADRGDITRCRKIVNGGAIGLDEVKARYIRALGVMR